MPDRIQHYELLNKLGTGGMGTVYRAKDTRSGQTVAIKLLHPHLASDPEYVRRFKREARIARGLNSPNIVRVLDFGQDGESQYIVMEYVQGQTLGQLVQKQGPLPIDQAVSIASQVAAALDEAHRHQVVHRDIKPQNIIIAPNGVVKVTDFGVARVMGETTMTQHGTFMGTAPYMAPDHLSGGVDIRSDIYSLGIVLYQMLTGVVPFNSDTPWATLRMHESASLPPLNALRSDAPPWLVRVTNRCLEKRPDRRFQTPGELMNALRTQGQGSDPLPPTLAPAATPDPWGRRVPFILGGSGAFAAVFVVALLIFSTRGGGGASDSGSTPSPSTQIEVPTVSAINCNPSTGTIGQPITCEATIQGEATDISWSSTAGSPPSTQGPTFVTIFSKEGDSSVTLKACNQDKCSTKSVNVTIAPPQAGDVVCNPLVAAVGQQIDCRLQGADASQHSWTASGGTPSSGTGSTFSTKFNSEESASVAVDRCSGMQCAATIQVLSAPAVTSLNCQPTSANVGDTITCNPTVDGTVTARSWFAPGGSPSTGSGASFATSYGTGGSKAITLTACNGAVCVSSPQSLNVVVPVTDTPTTTPTPSPGAPQIDTLDCGPSPVLTNQTVTCSASVSNATSCTWSGGGSFNFGTICSSFATSYSTAGEKGITLNACNSLGTCVSRFATPTVLSPPSILSLDCGPNPVLANQTVTCNASVSNATSCAWSGGGSPPNSDSCSSFSTSYSTAGGETIALQACNLGVCAPSSATVSVQPPGPVTLLYDDFTGPSLNTALWGTETSGGSTITQSEGLAIITIPASENAYADLFSLNSFEVGSIFEARVNVSGGQFYDHKGIGYADARVSSDGSVGETEAAMWRGQDSANCPEAKTGGAYANCTVTQSNYAAGWRTIKVDRVSSTRVDVFEDGILLGSLTTQVPGGLLPVRFSAWTYTTGAPGSPISIQVDWVRVYTH